MRGRNKGIDTRKLPWQKRCQAFQDFIQMEETELTKLCALSEYITQHHFLFRTFSQLFALFQKEITEEEENQRWAFLSHVSNYLEPFP